MSVFLAGKDPSVTVYVPRVPHLGCIPKRITPETLVRTKPVETRPCRYCRGPFECFESSKRAHCEADECRREHVRRANQRRSEQQKAVTRRLADSIAPGVPLNSEWELDGRAYRCATVTQHGNQMRVALQPIPRGQRRTVQACELRERGRRTK
jgi:hypothetical protein